MSFFSTLQKLHERKKVARIHMDEAGAVEKFAEAYAGSLMQFKRPCQSPVIVCIGTDRATGDCLGPLVGSQLAEMAASKLPVYGTLDDPVHASNLQEKLLEIQHNHGDSFIVAIDACLGNLDSVGFVNIGSGPLKPGAGVNKQLPEVGQLHITGIVNVGGFMEYFVLQNTRLNIVMKMAKIIASGIFRGHRKHETNMY